MTGINGERSEERLDLNYVISFESDGGDAFEDEDQAQVTDDFANYLLSVAD